MTLKEKKIIITGASQGLGAVCAREFSKLGAVIGLLSRSQEKLENVKNSCENSNIHMILCADQTDQIQLVRVIEKFQKTLGTVDVVVHCAGGGLGLRDHLLSQADFEALFKLNVSSAAQLNRLVVPEMMKQGFGNLVHVGSLASFEAVASVGYNSVKAAIAAYVRSLGRELIASSIIVTGIAPGGFIAENNAMDRLKINKPSVYENFIEQRLPRKTMANAMELIPMLTLLCSSQALMMGGCMVPIDAGEGFYYGV